jgi:hypothetical protein
MIEVIAGEEQVAGAPDEVIAFHSNPQALHVNLAYTLPPPRFSDSYYRKALIPFNYLHGCKRI